MFILTAQTSTNVAQMIGTILMRIERVRGAEWRHRPENVIFNYSKPLIAQTIIFTAQTSTNLAQTNSSAILIFWTRRGANFTQVSTQC